MSIKYKAVLFDLDGTLLDTAKDIMGACNYTLKKFGFQELEESVLRTKVTAGMREMMKLSVPKDLWESAGVDTVMRECFANYYTAHICDLTTPFDGMPELIEELHKNNIKTGVVTNKYFAMASKVLNGFEFTRDIELVLGCDSLTHSKPHPEPILAACKKLNVDPSQTLYLGDHKNDMTAANAAGSDCVAALWGYGEYECGSYKEWNATFSAKNPFDVKSIIFGTIQ